MPSHYTVGLRAKGKADRVAVDAEDALIAALKVKTERPDATITYVRRRNRRGDARQRTDCEQRTKRVHLPLALMRVAGIGAEWPGDHAYRRLPASPGL